MEKRETIITRNPPRHPHANDRTFNRADAKSDVATLHVLLEERLRAYIIQYFFSFFFVMIKICKHACCLKKIQKSCNNHLWFFGSWQSSSGCDPKPLRFVVWQHWTDQTQEQRRTTFKTLFFFFPWLVQLSCSGLGGCFMAWKYVLGPGNRDTHGRKRKRKEKTKWVKVFDMALKWKLKYERTKISSLDEILRSKWYIFSY